MLESESESTYENYYGINLYLSASEGKCLGTIRKYKSRDYKSDVQVSYVFITPLALTHLNSLLYRGVFMRSASLSNRAGRLIK